MNTSNYRFRFGPPVAVHTADPLVGEMQGHDGMGAHEEALKAARVILGRPRNKAASFYAALHVILTHADNLDQWEPCVVPAHQRLSKTAKAGVRYWMLTFYASLGNYEKVVAFLPKRFTGRYGLLELWYAMDAMLALDRLDEAGRLACKCEWGIRVAAEDVMKNTLRSALAEYFARVKDWQTAVKLWEELVKDECLAENAIHGLVEAGFAQAIEGVRKGLEAVAHLRTLYDPEMQLILPGNDKARWNELEAYLLERKESLEKLLPVEARKRFGL